MEDKIYSFHLYMSCEDVKSNLKFSYSVSLNLNEIIVHTSEKSTYIRTPEEMELVESKLKESEKNGEIHNLKFQNKVSIKIEDNQYKIVK